MDVQAAVARQIENGLGKNLAVCRDDEQVGSERAELGDEVFVAGALGLEHGNLTGEGEGFYGGGLELEVAASGTIGLGDDGDHGGDRPACEGGETRAGQFGGAHEDDAERGGHGEGTESEWQWLRARWPTALVRLRGAEQ